MGVRGERRGPERREKVPSQGTRMLMAVILLLAIFFAADIDADLRDGLRIFVLTQAAVVVTIYLQVISGVVARVFDRDADDLTNEIRRGHLCMLVAILVLLSEEIWQVYKRIGQDSLNWRTPILQLALLLLFLGWLWLERRQWRTDTSMLKPTPKEEARGRARQRLEQQGK